MPTSAEIARSADRERDDALDRAERLLDAALSARSRKRRPASRSSGRDSRTARVSTGPDRDDRRRPSVSSGPPAAAAAIVIVGGGGDAGRHRSNAAALCALAADAHAQECSRSKRLTATPRGTWRVRYSVACDACSRTLTVTPSIAIVGRARPGFRRGELAAFAFVESRPSRSRAEAASDARADVCR